MPSRFPCHAEGRGFESHHPLLETRWKRRVSSFWEAASAGSGSPRGNAGGNATVRGTCADPAACPTMATAPLHQSCPVGECARPEQSFGRNSLRGNGPLAHYPARRGRAGWMRFRWRNARAADRNAKRSAGHTCGRVTEPLPCRTSAAASDADPARRSGDPRVRGQANLDRARRHHVDHLPRRENGSHERLNPWAIQRATERPDACNVLIDIE